jgi:hypothetical protein
MIGDFATKPLQGALFHKLRDQTMGVTPARDPGPGNTNSNARLVYPSFQESKTTSEACDLWQKQRILSVLNKL